MSENKTFSSESFLKEGKQIGKETEAILRNLYPNSKVQVKITSHHRHPETQRENVKKGASKSTISLHNFGAAVDYAIFIDGKIMDGRTARTLQPYKVLGHVANKYDKFWGWDWDSGHVGETRFVDQFVRKYPEIANDPYLKDWYEMNRDESKLGYKQTLELLDSLYQSPNPNRKYYGKERTIDPLLAPYNPSNKQVFEYIK
tara:strand:+ start:289 stop:891 length:603 start_codon:yes stop_codon:yes gene_type:complete